MTVGRVWLNGPLRSITLHYGQPFDTCLFIVVAERPVTEQRAVHVQGGGGAISRRQVCYPK